MEILKERLLHALGAVLLIVAVAGCTDSTETAPTALSGNKPAQELTIAYGLDTDARTARGGGDMLLEIFSTERLVELEGTAVVPGLAKSWDIVGSGKTIVFHLRKDVRFSDGAPFNADAVKFTYDRLMSFHNTFWTETDRIEKLEVLDPHTVAFHYKAGLEGYIALTSFAEYHSSILSPNSVEPRGDPSAPVVRFTGTGPWSVAEYARDRQTLFVPNEHYHGLKPVLDRIIVKTIPKAEARVLALQSGEVDVVVDHYHGGSAYTPRNILKTLRDQGFQVLKKEMPMTTMIAFNYNREPWTDCRVRKAFNHAVNKDDIEALFDGWIHAAKERLFSDTAPYMVDADAKMVQFNRQEAERLLEEADFPRYRKVDLIAHGQNPDEVKLCELIKAQLAEVGITVQLHVLEAGVYSEKRQKGEYDLCIWYAAGPERRKFTRMDGRFNPEAPEFGGSGCFSSPEITAALKKAVGAFDEEERRRSFKELYRLLGDEAAFVPLYFDAVFVVAKPEVKGVEFISSEPRFDRASIGAN